MGICIGNSDFGEGIFAQIPPSPEGIFKIPERTRGIWPKIHDTKLEFCTYFFPMCWYISKDYLANAFQLQTVHHRNT